MAEDPKAVFGKVAPRPENGKEVSDLTLRRLCSRYPVNGVYTWKFKAQPPPHPGQLRRWPWPDAILQISFTHYGLVRQEWRSYGILARALMQWRNLEGAPLWIDGENAGKLTRKHSKLKEIDTGFGPAPLQHPHVLPAAPPGVAEAEDPKEFLKRMSRQQAQVGQEVHFGFAIVTSPQFVIEQNAQDAEITLTDANWETLNQDSLQLERNCMEILQAAGIDLREEGHDADGDLVGSAWMKRGSPGWELVRRWVDTDGELLMNYAQITRNTVEQAPQLFWRNVSELGQQLLDVAIDFFDVKRYFSEAREPTKFAEAEKPLGEDPKDFFRRMISGGKLDPRMKAYNEVLQYMPDAFKRAFQQKQYANFIQREVFDIWPLYDPDAEYVWFQASYYFNYYTEKGKIYLLVMQGNEDGSQDAVEEAEVGTTKAAELQKQFGPEGRREALRDYYQWVVENRADPLRHIEVPTVPVESKWVAGFVRHGGHLKLWGLRRLTKEKPSPPMVPWPDVKDIAAHEPQWKKALEYCLVDEDGTTEVTEEGMISDDRGKWDRRGRLIVRFSLTEHQPQAGQEDFIVAQAQQALNDLNVRQEPAEPAGGI